MHYHYTCKHCGSSELVGMLPLNGLINMLDRSSASECAYCETCGEPDSLAIETECSRPQSRYGKRCEELRQRFKRGELSDAELECFAHAAQTVTNAQHAADMIDCFPNDSVEHRAIWADAIAELWNNVDGGYPIVSRSHLDVAELEAIDGNWTVACHVISGAVPAWSFGIEN